MKSLTLYLIIVFVMTCAMLFVVTMIDPPEPVLLIDATPAAAKVGVPIFTCTYIMPPLDGTRKGINRA